MGVINIFILFFFQHQQARYSNHYIDPQDRLVITHREIMVSFQVLGIVCVSLVGHYIAYHKIHQATRGPSFSHIPDHGLFIPELFFLLIATTCLIASTLLLISCLISIATATILPKTVFVSSTIWCIMYAKSFLWSSKYVPLLGQIYYSLVQIVHICNWAMTILKKMGCLFRKLFTMLLP